jgi:hypothetical protein
VKNLIEKCLPLLTIDQEIQGYGTDPAWDQNSVTDWKRSMLLHTKEISLKLN